jgi:GNAT superfamily N-acetyltransferase
VGYACLYFSASSVEAEDIVIMNDLYVVPDARGGGVGRRLIEATVTFAGAHRRPLVRWSTAIDNRRAQRLYEQMGAERTAWFEYEVIVDRSDG